MKNLKNTKTQNKTKSNHFVTKVLELMSALFSMLVGGHCFLPGKSEMSFLSLKK